MPERIDKAQVAGHGFRVSKEAKAPKKKALGFFTLVMVMFGITTTLHGLSPLATYGLGSVFFLLLAALGFLIPAGLVAAELATGWPEEGGVYIWVSEAFGKDAGFLATWLQWLQNLIFWTVILTGSAAMLALGFSWESGANNRAYTAAIVLGTIWLCTALTTRGLGFTGVVATIGSLLGTILPGLILIGMAGIYLIEGRPSRMSWDPATFWPDFSQAGSFSFAISSIMIFAGVELMGTRVREMHDPERLYPLATWTSIVLTMLLLVPVVLSIAVLVPVADLNITAGLVQAIQAGLGEFGHLGWLAVVFALALYLDAVGEIGGWMAGTPISMAAAGRDGYLPARLGERTGDIAPSMLIAQGVAGSLVSLLFLFTPGVQSLFWLLSALLVQLYVGMYGLMFAAVWRLRKTQPDAPRAYKVPGGSFGLALVCGLGLTSSVAVFVGGFIRPPSLNEIGEMRYLLTLVIGMAISLGCPAWLILRRRRTLLR